MQLCMDWRSVKFDWNYARAFLVTAEEGSFSAAARALGLAQPTLGRQVSALESELGVTLFERAGNNLALTQSGLELVEHVRAMGDAATRVSLRASGQSQSIAGPVCITASELFSAFVLPPVIAKLRTAEPGITVEIAVSNDLKDLRRREADIAVRHARPSSPDLIAKKIMSDAICMYAAEGYIAQHGEIRSPADLQHARFVGLDNAVFVEGANAHGLKFTPDRFPVLSSSHLVYWELVKQGLGVGLMPVRIGDADPMVRRVAAWLKPFEVPIWLVTHREVNTSRRVRFVFDFLASEAGNA
jgi:DNA-binding transcriptional LysR family regulator